MSTGTVPSNEDASPRTTRAGSFDTSLVSRPDGRTASASFSSPERSGSAYPPTSSEVTRPDVAVSSLTRSPATSAASKLVLTEPLEHAPEKLSEGHKGEKDALQVAS